MSGMHTGGLWAKLLGMRRCLLLQQALRFTGLTLLGLAVSVWLSGCIAARQPSASLPAALQTDDCRTVEHERGSTKVCGQPQRIAVLSPHLLDVVLALGAQPAGYAESIDLAIDIFENPARQIPYLGQRISSQPVNLGDRKSPSLEKLAQLKPDLILGEDWLAGQHYDVLSSIGPTLLFSDYRNGEQHWRNSIQGVARALVREEAVEKVNVQVSGALETARQSLAPVVEALPRVLILAANSALTDVAIAADSTVGALLEDIGFELVFPQPTVGAGSRWQQTSAEVLPNLESDIAIVIGWDAAEFYSPQERLKENWNKNPLLKAIPAARAERILFVDYQLWGSMTRGPITDQLILQRLPELLSPLLPG